MAEPDDTHDHRLVYSRKVEGTAVYSPDLGGYVADITTDQLRAAPRRAADTAPVYDEDYRARVAGSYGLTFPIASL